MRKNLPVTNNEVALANEANILSTTDHQGKITFVNDDFLKISGFEMSELIGQDHNIVRHPDMPPAAFADLWAANKDRRTWKGIVKNRCKDGSFYWVDAFVIPIVDGDKVEYQSVRQKPARAAQQRAEDVYKKINQGESLGFSLNFKQKNLLLMTLMPALISAVFAAMQVISPVAALALYACIALAFGSAVLLNTPLIKAIKQCEDIGSDPLARYIYTGRQDEAGAISFALQILRSESAALIGRMQATSMEFKKKSENVYSVIGSSKSSTEEQFHETDGVATAATEMSASIQEVSSNAQLAAESAVTMSRDASSGKEVVHETQVLITSFTNEMERVSKSIGNVENDSNNISSILDVIKNVAEQTNLLALNAAIEAARAGEMGRGFAVVAEEVRTLANRTQDSTEQIEGMILALQGSTKESVSMMAQSIDQAKQCMEKAQNAVCSLDAIETSIETINNMNQQISQAVEEQSTVAENISRSTANIRELSRSNLNYADTSNSEAKDIDLAATKQSELSLYFWMRNRKLTESA